MAVVERRLHDRRDCGFHIWYAKTMSSSRGAKVIRGSFSNHDDDGNKSPTNLHIWQWKTVFLHALHVHFSSFGHFEDVLVLSTTWNDLFCSCVEDVSIWWQIFNLVLLCPKRWFQFNSRIVRTHFSSIMTLNNCKMIAERRSYIFRWRSCFRRRRVCLSYLLPYERPTGSGLTWLFTRNLEI